MLHQSYFINHAENRPAPARHVEISDNYKNKLTIKHFF